MIFGDIVFFDSLMRFLNDVKNTVTDIEEAELAERIRIRKAERLQNSRRKPTPMET